MNLSKLSSKVMDISRNQQDQANFYQVPPATPDAVWNRLQNVSFTNAKSDRPLVMELYKNEFQRRMGRVEMLDYAGLRWGNDEMESLALVLGNRGTTPNLLDLALNEGNCFDHVGCRVLAKALRQGCPQLKRLELARNKHMGNEGVQAMADALVRIETVNLSEINMGKAGCQALVDAAAKAREDSTRDKTDPGFALKYLRLEGNRAIGDEGGVAFLARGLASGGALRSLWTLNLEYCNVRNEDCQSLAEAASSSKEGLALRVLRISGTKLLTVQCVPHICTLLQSSRTMEQLWLPKTFRKIVIGSGSGGAPVAEKEAILEAAGENCRVEFWL